MTRLTTASFTTGDGTGFGFLRGHGHRHARTQEDLIDEKRTHTKTLNVLTHAHTLKSSSPSSGSISLNGNNDLDVPFLDPDFVDFVIFLCAELEVCAGGAAARVGRSECTWADTGREADDLLRLAAVAIAPVPSIGKETIRDIHMYKKDTDRRAS